MSSDLPVNVYFKIVHRVVDCLKYLIPFIKYFEQIVRTFSTQVHHFFFLLPLRSNPYLVALSVLGFVLT